MKPEVLKSNVLQLALKKFEKEVVDYYRTRPYIVL